MKTIKSFVLLLITLSLCLTKNDQLQDILEYDSFDCQNVNEMFEIKEQLLYWKELNDMDIIQQISDILEVKESLLNYKELILNKQEIKRNGLKILIQRVDQQILNIVHDLQNEKKELTLEYCDKTINQINAILEQRDSEKHQLQEVEGKTIISKMELVSKQLDHCNRELKSVQHNKVILQQRVSTKVNEIGYGFWFRLLDFYPEAYENDIYFVSRVSENEEFNGNDLGDNKLVVQVVQDSIIFSTYDLKSMNPSVSQDLDFEKSKWIYIHFSYNEGMAVGYIYYDKDEINKIEFHVEHFKLNQAFFKFGGEDLKNQGFNGQFAQLTYGVGEQYYIDNPQQFVKEAQQLSPKPQFTINRFNLIDKQTQFPSEFEKKFLNDFIDEYALSVWFKIEYLDADNIEIFKVNDDQKQNALSFYGGNSLSFGTYSKDQKNRKVELYEQSDEWHYLYMSYSYLKEEFNCFVWINGHILKFQEHNVKHYPTKELSFSVEKEFDGEINKLNFYIGEGSHFEDPKHLPKEYQEGLNFVEQNIVRSFEVTKDTTLKKNQNIRGK